MLYYSEGSLCEGETEEGQLPPNKAVAPPGTYYTLKIYGKATAPSILCMLLLLLPLFRPLSVYRNHQPVPRTILRY